MKIIIPTDFSKSTIKALKFLSSYHISASINIDVLYIESNVEVKVHDFKRKDWVSGKQKIQFLSNTQLEVLHEVSASYKYIDNIICRNGDLEEGILQEANSGRYDILLSATHSSHSLKELVFGNIAQHLVQDSLIPVLSLPNNYTISDSHRLLFVSNFDISEKCNFDFLRNLIEKMNLELHLLKIVEEGKQNDIEIKSNILSYMNSNNLKYEKMHIKEDRSIEEGIHHFLEEFDISFCAMATHARHGIKHFFLGSISEQLVGSLNVPLFTFRIQSHD